MAATLAECLDRKDNDLAAVRILAATAVLHAHAWIVVTPGVRTADFLHVFGFTLDFHGVHAFFILSGMLLMRSLMTRPDALRFVVARIMRYVPGIFVAALSAALVVGPLVTTLPLSGYFGSGALASFVAAVTTLYDVNATLPGVFTDAAEPGILFVPLWTIHYELVFALALAGAFALGLLGYRRLMLAGLAAVFAVNVVWFWNGEEHAHLGSPHHLVRFVSTFGIGVALALFADRVQVSNRIFLTVLAISIPLAFTPLAALAGMGLIAYSILWIGFCRGQIAHALSRLGVWSYGFYVWGYLVEQIAAWFAPHASGAEIALAAFPVALAAGWLSWTFVEKPSIALTGPITAALRRPFAGRRSTEPSVPGGRP